MNQKDDGGSAFPHCDVAYHALGEDWRSESVSGMTLRDWFAGQALMGALHRKAAPFCFRTNMDELAIQCYAQADEMLKARGQ